MYANVGDVVFQFNWKNIKVSAGRDIVMMFPNFFWKITIVEMNPVVDCSDWVRYKYV